MSRNAYAEEARRKKVNKLVDAIDRMLRKSRVDPYNAVDRVEAFTREQWASFAILAACNPPSEISKDAVLEIYRERAKPSEEAWGF